MKGIFGGALNQGITPEELTEAVVQAYASTLPFLSLTLLLVGFGGRQFLRTSCRCAV